MVDDIKNESGLPDLSAGEFNSDVLMTNLLVRVACLENLLVDKGLLDRKVLNKNAFDMTSSIMRKVLSTSLSSEKIEEVISEFKKSEIAKGNLEE